MKFIINEEEKRQILEQHNLYKEILKSKSKVKRLMINEQVDIDLKNGTWSISTSDNTYNDYQTDEIESDETSGLEKNINNNNIDDYSDYTDDEENNKTAPTNTTTTTQTPSSKNKASINVQPWSEFVKEKTKRPKLVNGVPQQTLPKFNKAQ